MQVISETLSHSVATSNRPADVQHAVTPVADHVDAMDGGREQAFAGRRERNARLTK